MQSFGAFLIFYCDERIKFHYTVFLWLFVYCASVRAFCRLLDVVNEKAHLMLTILHHRQLIVMNVDWSSKSVSLGHVILNVFQWIFMFASKWINKRNNNQKWKWLCARKCNGIQCWRLKYVPYYRIEFTNLCALIISRKYHKIVIYVVPKWFHMILICFCALCKPQCWHIR